MPGECRASTSAGAIYDPRLHSAVGRVMLARMALVLDDPELEARIRDLYDDIA